MRDGARTRTWMLAWVRGWALATWTGRASLVAWDCNDGQPAVAAVAVAADAADAPGGRQKRARRRG